jgi:hypothetical protein
MVPPTLRLGPERKAVSHRIKIGNCCNRQRQHTLGTEVAKAGIERVANCAN